MKIDTEDWPRCDRCDMPVEEFCVTDTGDALVFVAKCHRQVETVTLTSDILENLKVENVEFGPAFKKENV